MTGGGVGAAAAAAVHLIDLSAVHRDDGADGAGEILAGEGLGDVGTAGIHGTAGKAAAHVGKVAAVEVDLGAVVQTARGDRPEGIVIGAAVEVRHKGAVLQGLGALDGTDGGGAAGVNGRTFGGIRRIAEGVVDIAVDDRGFR